MKTFDIMVPQPELGKSARELRKEKNLTQLQFANITGFSRVTINNFETGKSQSLDVLRAYLKLNEGYYGINDKTDLK